MKSPTIRLKLTGSSIFSVCPQFGMIDRAAEGMVSLSMMPGRKQGQSSSPFKIKVGTVSFCSLSVKV
jgi:hypothetical protein